jgi:hypothetical protein
MTDKEYHFGDDTVRVMRMSASVLKAILIKGDKVNLDAAGYGGTELEAIADLNQALIKAAEDER